MHVYVEYIYVHTLPYLEIGNKITIGISVLMGCHLSLKQQCCET
jgi:hypothetical protein